MNPNDAIIPQNDPNTTSHALNPPSGKTCAISFSATVGSPLLVGDLEVSFLKYGDVEVYGDSAVPGSSRGPGVRTFESAAILIIRSQKEQRETIRKVIIGQI
jgi:hypothetical protein